MRNKSVLTFAMLFGILFALSSCQCTDYCKQENKKLGYDSAKRIILDSLRNNEIIKQAYRNIQSIDLTDSIREKHFPPYDGHIHNDARDKSIRTGPFDVTELHRVIEIRHKPFLSKLPIIFKLGEISDDDSYERDYDMHPHAEYAILKFEYFNGVSMDSVVIGILTKKTEKSNHLHPNKM